MAYGVAIQARSLELTHVIGEYHNVQQVTTNYEFKCDVTDFITHVPQGVSHWNDLFCVIR